MNLDRLSLLLEQFRVRAHLFYNGSLCGVTRFSAQPGRAFLHILRRGQLSVRHDPRDPVPEVLTIDRPSLLFYPRPLEHAFYDMPNEGSDFTCATLDFDGGEHHPLARSLPDLIIVPLEEAAGLEQALGLLFAETESVRCGHRLLADRLFEIVLLQLLRWLFDHPDRCEIPVGLFRGLSHPPVARALLAIQSDPGRDWTVQSLAQEAKMSRSAFAVQFKHWVGDTPADYLAQWRLSLACQRLTQGHSAKRIALDLGYANPSALSRLFRQRTGQSMREWLAARQST